MTKEEAIELAQTNNLQPVFKGEVLHLAGTFHRAKFVIEKVRPFYDVRFNGAHSFTKAVQEGGEKDV